MERLQRTPSQEALNSVHTPVESGGSSKASDTSSSSTSGKTPEKKETEAAAPSGPQYTSDQTIVGQFWNGYVALRRQWTGSPDDTHDEVKEALKGEEVDLKALDELLGVEAKVGCNVGAMATVLEPYFGEAGIYKDFLPKGTDCTEFALALENKDLPQNKVLIGEYRDFLETFTDVLQKKLVPRMVDPKISLSMKVLEMNRLSGLEQTEASQSTPYMAVLTCFEKLTPDDQKVLMEGHFKDIEDPMKVLREGEDVGVFQTMFTTYLNSEEGKVERDWACFEGMTHYLGLMQGNVVKYFFKALSEEGKAYVNGITNKVAPALHNDRAPDAGVDGFSVFVSTHPVHKDSPVGYVAQKTIEELNLHGEDAFKKAMAPETE